MTSSTWTKSNSNKKQIAGASKLNAIRYKSERPNPCYTIQQQTGNTLNLIDTKIAEYTPPNLTEIFATKDEINWFKNIIRVANMKIIKVNVWKTDQGVGQQKFIEFLDNKNLLSTDYWENSALTQLHMNFFSTKWSTFY